LHLFEHKPEAIALDLHPEYLSTKLGKELGISEIYSIQHHHAHIAACMAENGINLETKPILGIALDGLGYGEDGTLWGGEFLLADYRSYQRLASFKPVAMLGGEKAIYQPWRNTYSHLMAGFNWDELKVKYRELEIVEFLDQQPRSLLNQMLAKGINSPLASSAGRLFDAVAAALGICRDLVSYEGQGAIELEALVDGIDEQTGYLFEIIPAPISYLEPRPMWQALLTDIQQGVSPCVMAARFHFGLAKAIASMVDCLRETHSFSEVALTGGVFQNQVLLEQVSQQLNVMDLTVLTHSLVPANDGGLSLGQVAIAAARSIQKGI